MKLFLSLLLITFSTIAFTQPDTTTPPYRRFPILPPLQLLLADSITKYTSTDLPKKKPVLILFFSPDCDHCQQETEQLLARKKDFENIHILMVTTYPVYRMKEFSEKYQLAEEKNIIVARDIYYFLPTFYAIRNFPYLAMYNKKGKLLHTAEGSVSMDTILDIFRKQ